MSVRVDSDGRPVFKSFKEYAEAFSHVVGTLSRKVPELRDRVFLKGTAPVSAMHTAHRMSWDVDLSTYDLGDNPYDLAVKLQRAFGNKISLPTNDPSLMGYQGALHLDGTPPIDIDLFSSVEAVRASRLENHTSFKGIRSVSAIGYIETKAGTLTRRDAPKDSIDLAAMYGIPSLQGHVRQQVSRACGPRHLTRALDALKPANVAGFNTNIPGFKPVTSEATREFVEFLEGLKQKKIEIREQRQREIREERWDRDLSMLP